MTPLYKQVVCTHGCIEECLWRGNAYPLWSALTRALRDTYLDGHHSKKAEGTLRKWQENRRAKLTFFEREGARSLISRVDRCVATASVRDKNKKKKKNIPIQVHFAGRMSVWQKLPGQMDKAARKKRHWRALSGQCYNRPGLKAFRRRDALTVYPYCIRRKI